MKTQMKHWTDKAGAVLEVVVFVGSVAFTVLFTILILGMLAADFPN